MCHVRRGQIAQIHKVLTAWEKRGDLETGDEGGGGAERDRCRVLRTAIYDSHTLAGQLRGPRSCQTDLHHLFSHMVFFFFFFGKGISYRVKVAGNNVCIDIYVDIRTHILKNL